jgi:hypothetical protein
MKVVKEKSLYGNCKLKLVKGKNDKKYRFKIICCDYDRKRFTQLSLVNNFYNGIVVFNNMFDFLYKAKYLTTSILRQVRVYYSFDRPYREEYSNLVKDNNELFI